VDRQGTRRVNGPQSPGASTHDATQKSPNPPAGRGPSGRADANRLRACLPGVGPETRGKDVHAGHACRACCANTGEDSRDYVLVATNHAVVRE